MAHHNLIPPPQPMDCSGNVAQNWEYFEKAWDNYATAIEITKKSEEIQSANLKSIMGKDCFQILQNLPITEAEAKVPKNVLDTLREHFAPQKNTIYERYMFNTANQLPNEKFDAYLVRLRKLASTCDFGQLIDQMIRDRLVIGIRDSNVRARLLRESELTLNKAIELIRSSERAAEHAKEIDPNEDTNQVHYVMKKKKQAYKGGARPKTNTSSKPQQKQDKSFSNCGRCGTQHPPRNCPAFKQVCKYCKKVGHLITCCRKLKYKKMHEVEVETEDEVEDTDLFIASIEEDKKKENWHTTVKIGQRNIKLKIDTGADCNAISISQLKSCGIKENQIQKSRNKLVAYSGDQIKIIGQVLLQVEHKGKFYPLKFYVTHGEPTPILGRSASVELGVVQRIYALTEQKRITEESLFKEYDDLFTGLGKIPVEYHIEINKDATPVISPPRKLPEQIRPLAKKELDRMVDLDVIEKVNGHTPWVSNMVVKVQGDKVRICIDPSNLNKAIKREHYPLNTLEEVAARMPNAKKFTVLDASKGFWQVPLDEESSYLCTMATPWGRYRFKRMPFGLISSSEVFQKLMREMIDDIEYTEVIVDDVIIGQTDDDDDDSRIITVLDRLRDNNVKLNKPKTRVRVDEVKYSGHIMSSEGLKPDPEKVNAILQMPQPQNKTELQRFFGMATYMSKFIPNYSTHSAPLRLLLEGETEWHWEKEQQDSFEKLKQLLADAPVLKRYDVKKPVTLITDASGNGLGAVIMQDDHPIAYSSKSLTDTQKRYVSIEREMLAVVHGCHKFDNYIFGKKVTVLTDHKPLESIMKKNISQCPARLQNMRMVLQRYDLEVKYVKGTSDEMKIADTLSRASTNQTFTDYESEFQVCTVLCASKEKIEEIRAETEKDEELQTLTRITRDGWPENQSKIPTSMKPYWNFRDEISVYNGIVFKAEQMIIPKAMRSEMLSQIHSAHLGITLCQNRARSVMYWPNINSEIKNEVDKCHICNQHKSKEEDEPLITEELPNLPWYKVGSDLFELDGEHYCILVDYYSNFIEVSHLPDTSSKTVIKVLKAQFARHGIPKKLRSDNGPQYTSFEFKKFSLEYRFEHETSSPRYPRANGLAENAVKTVKNLMKKAKASNKDPYLALLEYRNTPRNSELGSPAQRLFSRSTRTILPVTEKSLKPKIVNKVQESLQKEREIQKRNILTEHQMQKQKCFNLEKQSDTKRVHRVNGSKDLFITKLQCQDHM